MKPVRSDGGIVAYIRRFWQRSYASDYVGFAIIIAITFWIHAFVEPVHQMFRLDDRARQYPHALVQRVSSTQNILLAGIGPLAILVLWAVVTRPGFHKAHVTILGLFISIFLTSLLTDVVKNAIGRPRPDLIARCKPAPGTPEHDLVTISVCTETDHHTLHDGWRSFPSGHSSWAFSGLGYLALFLAGQLHVFRPQADLTRILIFLAPLVAAALVAMSRLADYRHDIYDVTSGSLLGILVAYLTYRRYFRALGHPKCDEPYPNPLDAALVKAGKARDLEAQRFAEEFVLEDQSEDESQAYLLTESGATRSREQAAAAEPP